MALFSPHTKRSNGPQRRPSFNTKADRSQSDAQTTPDARMSAHREAESSEQEASTDGRSLRRRPSGSVKVAHVPGAPKEQKVKEQKASPLEEIKKRAHLGRSSQSDKASQENPQNTSGAPLSMQPARPEENSAAASTANRESQPSSSRGFQLPGVAPSRLKRRPSVNAKMQEEKRRQEEAQQNPQDRFRAQSPKSDGLSVRMEEKFFGSHESAEVPADNAVKDALKSGAARVQDTVRSFTSSVSPDKAREGAQGALRGVAVVAAVVFQWIVAFLKRRGKMLAICGGIFLIVFFSAYFPAKDYYVAYRANQRAQNELQANIDHNNALKGEISHLQTQEGVEDFARQNLGMVKANENSLRLTGASAQSEPEANEYQTNKRIEKDSGTAPVSWKTKFLDFFFGVGDTSKSPNHRDSSME